MSTIKKILSVIVAVTVFVTGFGMVPTTVVNADMVTVSDWETLKSALESGETVIMLRAKEPIVATSDINVTLDDNNKTVWIFSAEGKDIISMDYTNYGIHVSGEGVLRLENVPFNNYSNPCIVNEDSDNVDVNIKNCGFYNGDGKAISGHYTEAKMLQSEEVTGHPIVGSEPGTPPVGGADILNTTFSAEMDGSIAFGDSQLVNFTVSASNATGKVYVDIYDSINNNTFSRKVLYVENGKAMTMLSNLTVGNHTLTAVYGGDAYHLPSIVSRNIEVLKCESDTRVSAMDISSGETEIISVDVTGLDKLNGDVVVDISRNNVTVVNETLSVVNGIAVLPIDNLTSGYYKVVAEYQENENCYGSMDETGFHVINGTVTMPTTKVKTKVSVGMNSTIEYGDSQMLHYQVGDNFTTGKVVVDVMDEARKDTYFNRVVPVNNGTADVLLETLSAGNYSMRTIYGGDEDHQAAINYSNLTVNKAKSMLNVSATDYVYGQTGLITVDVADAKGNNITGDVNVDIYYGDISVINNTVDVINGTAKIPVNELKDGKYTVWVRYDGDTNYLGSDGEAIFTVSKEAPAKPTVVKPATQPSEISVFKKEKPKVASAGKGRKKKKIRIKLDKIIKNADGYIVRVYTKKKKNGKVILKKTVKKNKLKFSISSKKLRKYDNIFIKVRAYKKISNKRYVSLMSKAKAVEIKK